MTEVTYSQGMTTVWSDGEKVVIKNPNGIQYVKHNVEQIFGMGEYDKIYSAKYSHETKAGSVNRNARSVEIVSGYIPQRVLTDLLDKSVPGNSETDLIGKYFK